MEDTKQPEALRRAVAAAIRLAREGDHQAADILRAQITHIQTLEAELYRYRAALNEWLDRTQWVQKTIQSNELGKHLADVLRERIEKLQDENATLQAGYSAARLEIESLRARGAAPAGKYPEPPMSTAMHAIDGVTACWPSDQMRAYGEACWKAGYKHGAWADTKPAGAQPAGEQVGWFQTHPAESPQGELVPLRECLKPADSRDGWQQEPVFRADRAMRAAQPAGAQQPDGIVYTSAAQDVLEAWFEEIGLDLDVDDVKRLFDKMTAASHGQAPAQADTKTHALLSTMVDLLLNFKDKIGYKPGSVIDKTVSEAVEHLKDWPYPEPAQAAPADVAGPLSEHYDEVRATLTGLHALCENVSAQERRIGPLGSHARGYTWKITAALRHLDALAAAPTTQPAPQHEAGPHVTDAMALAFHSALSDGALGSDEVEEIKAGLRAALDAAPTAQPEPQQEAQRHD